MSLQLTLNKAARGILAQGRNQVATVGIPRVAGGSLFTPAPTAPLQGSLKSTGVVRSFGIGDLGGILSVGGSILGGSLGGKLTQIGGILGGGGLPSVPTTLPGGAPNGNTGGITATGTAGGGCINTAIGSICAGGSLGAGQFQGPGNGQLPVMTGVTGGSSSVAVPGACMRGYHLNKTGYWTSQGYVAPGTKLVRNRRRNPLNPRALSRSLSRITGFDRAVRGTEKRLAKVARRAAPRRSAPRGRSCGCKK